MSANRTSGRPRRGEYAAYGESDVAMVEGDDAVAALLRQRSLTVELFETFGDAGGSLAYAPGKWTVKGVLGHLADDERIYAYRALCIARGDPRPLPGFDENDYARAAAFDSRTLADLLADYEAVRNASITLFRGLPPEALRRRGIANDHEVTPRGLAFHIAGHELHHHAILRERYLPLLSKAGCQGLPARVETYRGAVYPSQCDHMGHMNVASYVAKFDEATWQLFAAIGLTPSRLRGESLGMAGVEQHIEYKRELFPGDVVAVASTILEIKDKAIRFAHDMTNAETGELAARMVVVAVHLDRSSRKARSFPADIRERVRAMAGE